MNYIKTKIKRLLFLISGLKTKTAVIGLLICNYLHIRPTDNTEWIVMVICVLVFTLRDALKKGLV